MAEECEMIPAVKLVMMPSLVVKMHVKKRATGFPFSLSQERLSISFSPDHACSL